MRLIRLSTQSPSKVIWINIDFIITLEEVKSDQCTYIQTVNGIHYVEETIEEIIKKMEQFRWPNENQ